MALAPYWLIPRLWPLPLPVMVKVPSLENAGVWPSPTVDVPKADSTDALPSSLTVFPPPLRTLIPSKERITVLLSLI